MEYAHLLDYLQATSNSLFFKFWAFGTVTKGLSFEIDGKGKLYLDIIGYDNEIHSFRKAREVKVARIESEGSCRASGYDDIRLAINWHFTSSCASPLL